MTDVPAAEDAAVANNANSSNAPDVDDAKAAIQNNNEDKYKLKTENESGTSCPNNDIYIETIMRVNTCPQNRCDELVSKHSTTVASTTIVPIASSMPPPLRRTDDKYRDVSYVRRGICRFSSIHANMFNENDPKPFDFRHM